MTHNAGLSIDLTETPRVSGYSGPKVSPIIRSSGTLLLKVQHSFKTKHPSIFAHQVNRPYTYLSMVNLFLWQCWDLSLSSSTHLHPHPLEECRAHFYRAQNHQQQV